MLQLKYIRHFFDVGHLVFATGRGVLRLISFISANVFCAESVTTGTDVCTPAEIS